MSEKMIGLEKQEMTPEELEQQEYINQLSDEELKELWEDRVASDAVDDMKNEYPDW
jgi:hypothetical protein